MVLSHGVKCWSFIPSLWEATLNILLVGLQYFDHLMRRADSLEKTLKLGKIEGRGRRGRQRMRWFDGITDSIDMSLIQTRVCVCVCVCVHASVLEQILPDIYQWPLFTTASIHCVDSITGLAIY